jgi:hypothetical protein
LVLDRDSGHAGLEKYTIVWDGRDDLGEPLPRAITPWSWVAREHGTHARQREDRPRRAAAGRTPAGSELEAATVATAAPRMIEFATISTPSGGRARCTSTFPCWDWC